MYKEEIKIKRKGSLDTKIRELSGVVNFQKIIDKIEIEPKNKSSDTIC
jgi:hypothetical protein